MSESRGQLRVNGSRHQSGTKPSRIRRKHQISSFGWNRLHFLSAWYITSIFPARSFFFLSWWPPSYTLQSNILNMVFIVSWKPYQKAKVWTVTKKKKNIKLQNLKRNLVDAKLWQCRNYFFVREGDWGHGEDLDEAEFLFSHQSSCFWQTIQALAIQIDMPIRR